MDIKTTTSHIFSLLIGSVIGAVMVIITEEKSKVEVIKQPPPQEIGQVISKNGKIKVYINGEPYKDTVIQIGGGDNSLNMNNVHGDIVISK